MFNRTLIYHLYCGPDFLTNKANDIHRVCLDGYSHIFDKVIVSIAVDDLSDKNKIQEGINWVMNIFAGKELSIDIIQNTSLYEVETFKKQILDKLSLLDGFVFFAHNKGSSTLNSYYWASEESYIRWIIGMYYFNLEFFEEAQDKLTGKNDPPEFFFGAFLSYINNENKENREYLVERHGNCYYQGTFYWMNIPALRNYINEGIFHLPEIGDRYFAEMLPGTLCNKNAKGGGLATHKDVVITDMGKCAMYNYPDEEWVKYCEESESMEFFEFCNNVLNLIN